MAVITRTVTVANIFESPADVYFGLTAPTSSSTPTSDANTLTLDASGQPTSSTGFHAGLIEAPTMPTITEKCNEIDADQFEMAVDVGFDSIMAEFDCILKETSLSNINQLLTCANLSAYNAITGMQVLQFGGVSSAAASPLNMTVIAPNRAVAGKFVYWMLYQAVLKSAYPFAIGRSKETAYKLKFSGILDLTRVNGDQLMQIYASK
jgi:hypothetical protein